jgi:hypothetical protein
MKRLLLFSLLVFIFQIAKAQRLVPFVANNQQHILNDDLDNFSCYDGEVIHDSLFVSVYYSDTLSHSALRVLKNNVLIDVPLDWEAGDGKIFDLFSGNNKLYAAGHRYDSNTGSLEPNLAVYENGDWNHYSYPPNTRFYFGSVFNEKVYLFGSSLKPVCFFENGVFNEIAVDSVVDAQVYDEKLFFIDRNYSGVNYLDSLGEVHTEEIACDSLLRFSMVNGQLFVSGKCNEFLFRRNENAEWVFDDLGVDFSSFRTTSLGSVYLSQRGYLANFTNDIRSQLQFYAQSNSYELLQKNELNKYILNVINFEGKEFAICRSISAVDGMKGGICTLENGWKQQNISNQLVSETSYPSFSSYLYQSSYFTFDFRPIGLGYKDKKVVFTAAPLLYGIKNDLVSGVGGLFETGLNGAYAGPLSNIYSNEFAKKYDRVWRVKQSEIEYHNQHWYEANYSAPIDILEWPGNGSIVNGEPQIIAPFHDVNGNNIYEPQFGDAPEIKGDEAAFYIVSDGREVSPNFLNSLYEGTVSNIEMSVMTYLFHNASSQALSQTVFTDYRIVLRDETPLNEFYFGMHTDFDLGSGFDDFIGCDSTRNLVFGYNADDFDEQSSMSYGYANEVPACGYRFLNSAITSSVYFNASLSPVYGQPNTNEQLYNVLKGKRIDGSSILNPITQQQTSFMYSGEVGVPGVWNEVNVQNPGGDRRLIVSAFVGDLQPNVPLCISVARIVGSDTLSAGSPSVNAVYKMKQYSDEVQQYYDQYLQTTDCNQLVGVEELNEELLGVHVYPNPAKEKITIQTTRSSISKIELFNIVGSLVHSETRLKTANTSVDISAYTPGLYSVRIYLEDGTTEVRKIIVE